jgi:hypothetical protein
MCSREEYPPAIAEDRYVVGGVLELEFDGAKAAAEPPVEPARASFVTPEPPTALPEVVGVFVVGSERAA